MTRALSHVRILPDVALHSIQIVKMALRAGAQQIGATIETILKITSHNTLPLNEESNSNIAMRSTVHPAQQGTACVDVKPWRSFRPPCFTFKHLRNCIQDAINGMLLEIFWIGVEIFAHE
jgi:hypothetical protein